MFKNKNTITFSTLINIFVNKPNVVYVNDTYNANTINISMASLPKFYTQLCVELSKSMLLDITGITQNKLTITHNITYNFSWDKYIVYMSNKKKQNTCVVFFYNAMWAERETKEMLGVVYKNSIDSRNLLLNYNDNNKYLQKFQPVQNQSELKTNWHNRKINTINNNNVEI